MDEKEREFNEIMADVRKIERADKAKIHICEKQIRLLRACFSELYDEFEKLKKKAKNDMTKLVNKIENKLLQDFETLEMSLEK